VTRGIVSGLDRTVPTSRSTALSGAIQTDAAINPGNSGGPLVDAQGRVIGINTAIADPSGAQNVGFAIPISQAKPIIAALRVGDRPAYLGVTIDTESTEDGALVRTIGEGTPAGRAGMRAGDLIVSIGGEPVTSWERLRPAIREHKVGDTVDVVVVRDGERVFLMHRTDAGGDPRLHGKASIGVGGHLNPVDEGEDALMAGLRREWAEELQADWEPEFTLIGLLNDDGNPVGAVHLGVVFSVQAAGRPVAVRERDKLVGAFAGADELAATWDRLETWSQLVAEELGLGSG
jgi:putative serine protease PepD